MKPLNYLKILIVILFVCPITSIAQQNKSTLIIKNKSTLSSRLHILSKSSNHEIESDSTYLYKLSNNDIVEEKIYLNGKNVLLKIDVKDQLQLKIEKDTILITSGRFKLENQYNIFKAFNLKSSWSKKESIMDSSAFLNSMCQIMEKGKKKLYQIEKNTNNKDWVNAEIQKLKYFVYARKIAYPFLNAAYRKTKRPKSLPSFSKEIICKEVFNDTSIIHYGGGFIQAFMYYYARYKMDKYKDYPNPRALTQLELIQNLVDHPQIKSLFSQYILESQLAVYSTAGIEPILNYFNKNCKNQQRKNELLNKVELLSILGPGMPAPEIEFITPNGGRSLLSDFKGKNIFIDVWATY